MNVCQILGIGIRDHSEFSKALAPDGSQKCLISCLLQHKVISQSLRNNGTSQKPNKAKTTQTNTSFSSTRPTAQISMPESENMTPSETWRVVDVTQIKRIHFDHMAIFPLTGLLIALV
ncbi:hypothetical protein O181_013669 [Austropuccinia psidii MF-1]|uniref:Uncharacterized protein n=1 Tax=Austropuccinia psidii MF-1 TaxID=1389203 RepID=A0A9Q3BWU5_9BASI|nr:hypothetical protein [Austropuccinia psidii MF-1]